jgi:hypothetical protein
MTRTAPAHRFISPYALFDEEENRSGRAWYRASGGPRLSEIHDVVICERNRPQCFVFPPEPPKTYLLDAPWLTEAEREALREQAWRERWGDHPQTQPPEQIGLTEWLQRQESGALGAG